MRMQAIAEIESRVASASVSSYKEGREKGKKEGREEGKIEIAAQLLDLLDDETIAHRTGFTIKQIEALREANNR